MKAISGRELCQTLERHGWVLLRVHGSHHYYGKEGVDVKLSVPVQIVFQNPIRSGLA